jgi:hypothetical protein
LTRKPIATLNKNSINYSFIEFNGNSCKAKKYIIKNFFKNLTSETKKIFGFLANRFLFIKNSFIKKTRYENKNF